MRREGSRAGVNPLDKADIDYSIKCSDERSPMGSSPGALAASASFSSPCSLDFLF